MRKITPSINLAEIQKVVVKEAKGFAFSVLSLKAVKRNRTWIL